MVQIKRIEIVLLTLLSLFVIFDFLEAITFGAVFAILGMPFHTWLTRWVKSKNVSAFVTTLFVLFAIIAPFFWVIRSLILNQGTIISFLNTNFAKLAGVFEFFGAEAQLRGLEIVSIKLGEMLSGFLFSLPGIIFELLIMLFLIFYFIRDSEDIGKYITRLGKRLDNTELFKELRNVLQALIYGYFVTAVIIGILSWGIFTLLGIGQALVLSILVGITALLPVIGTWIIFSFLIIIQLLQGNVQLVIILIIVATVLQIIETLIPPHLTSHHVKVHPMLMMLGFIGGPLAMGIKGIILGPVILSALKILLEEYRNK